MEKTEKHYTPLDAEERATLMVVLAKMPDGTAQSALDGFSEALSAIPPE